MKALNQTILTGLTLGTMFFSACAGDNAVMDLENNGGCGTSWSVRALSGSYGDTDDCVAELQSYDFSTLRVVYNGAVVPETTRTTITYTDGDSANITEEIVDFAGNVLATGTTITVTLDADDVATLNEIIAVAELESRADLDADALGLSERCAGGRGYTIAYLAVGGVENEFDIGGDIACNDDAIPAELQDLIAFTNEIIDENVE